MEVRKGYKQTDIGVIPEDWDVISLGDIFDFKNGLNKEKQYFGQGTPIVNYMDVYKHRGLYAKDLKGRVTLSKQEIKNFEVKKGDVFFTRTSETVEEVGVSSVMLDDVVDTVFSGFVLRATHKSDRMDNEFEKYCYSTIQVRKEITSKSSYTTRALTNGSHLSKVKIALPTKKSEQHAIAAALSDVDSLLTALDSLIAKKRLVKQGAMQELFTGKRRLSGFSEVGYKQTEIGYLPKDWDIKALKELTTLLTNGFVGKATTHYTEAKDGVLYIQGFNVEENSFNLTGIKKVDREFHNRNAKSHLREGDLLTIQTGDVGLTTIVPKELEGSNCHALIISRFRQEKVFPKFFSQYFNSAFCRQRLASIETGTTMKHLNVTDMLEFQVPLPPLLEQQAIAEILSDMDAEINALESRREKTRQLKAGMMQELLTGRIRLI